MRTVVGGVSAGQQNAMRVAVFLNESPFRQLLHGMRVAEVELKIHGRTLFQRGVQLFKLRRIGVAAGIDGDVVYEMAGDAVVVIYVDDTGQLVGGFQLRHTGRALRGEQVDFSVVLQQLRDREAAAGPVEIEGGPVDVEKGKQGSRQGHIGRHAEGRHPVGGIAALKAGADQLSAGVNALAQGSAKLDNGNKALADGAKTLADGTSALSDGTKELSNGSNQLKDGAGDLADGAAKLDNGAGELHDGVVKLADGTVALDDGALELMEGMSQFETEGMEKLADVFGNKLTDMVDRLTALNDAGTSYKNFAGASGSENDSVKFIFKTESVKAE